MAEGSLIIFIVQDEAEIAQRKKKEKKYLAQQKKAAAIQVQAWWRGTLTRRSLLCAALNALTIQRWWRLAHLRLLEEKRKEKLMDYSRKERAVVKLQSLVRMWRIHWRYRQVLSAISVIQCHWQYHSCQACSLLRGHCVVTATHLQFHIEIIDH